ncbi:MAG TPA: N-acetylmuramoyl-L-alanine amidase [Acidimicrobiales bacterium]|nr:N-acetylmuramoyl-L-alanine amidase [Acidimicrobiales bacterium]
MGRRLVVGAFVAAAAVTACFATGGAPVPSGLQGGMPVAQLSSYSGGSVVTGVAGTSTGRGFWVASSSGAVTPEGDAVSHGDASGIGLAAPIVGIAPTPTGGGYWLLGGDGGVFTFGDAGFHGSMGGSHLNGEPLQIVGTRSGNGYWFVARDGGVFTFGDAGFYGSTGSMRLNQPVVGMAATPSGHGYWLVARDGGVFTFGDAGFYGSTGSMRLNQPVVGMAATPSGHGYWLVARDGGVFTFGDAGFSGSAGGSPLPAPAIGIVASPDGAGYWIALGNGQVRAFGDAAALQTQPVPTTGYSLVGQIVSIDPGHDGGNGSDSSYINQLVWNGREWETCDTTGTATNSGYTEAAFNFDVAGRLAALLHSEGATVVLTRNTNGGVGPCVNQRAAIGNAAHADVMLDIHADGGPAGGYGFAVLEPVADGPNNGVISRSDTLAAITRDTFRSVTGEPVSTYDGVNGLQPRNDLAGLNLTTVPKVLIECANMRNSGDASRLTSSAWRQSAAAALNQSASRYLIGFP